MTDETYVAIDVETPNAANDRMSAIGLTVVERGCITEEFYTLVNPEVRFDAFNVYLTGINPAAVAGKPDFAALWEQIEPILCKGVLVAHNAPFDMRVLARCIASYGVQWHSAADYLCTCRMGKACYPYLPDHRLDTMCRHAGIELDHHNAGSDSRACALLLLDYLEHGLDAKRYLSVYDLRLCRTVTKKKAPVKTKRIT